jgi:hypothetical protein
MPHGGRGSRSSPFAPRALALRIVLVLEADDEVVGIIGFPVIRPLRARPFAAGERRLFSARTSAAPARAG